MQNIPMVWFHEMGRDGRIDCTSWLSQAEEFVSEGCEPCMPAKNNNTTSRHAADEDGISMDGLTGHALRAGVFAGLK